ncbi:MAG: ribonuclease HIII [Solobacterium sp.]|nr:ribonuclease HIII [Solobacterium sp.]
MNTRTTITLNLNRDQSEKLYQAFFECARTAPPYAEWSLKCENCTITRYLSGKTVFQGPDAEVYASPFMNETTGEFPQAGSDEVGTGDYFGPVCVCAVYCSEKDADIIRSTGAHDCKQMKDSDVREAAVVLMEKLTHSLLIVEDPLYNKVHADTNLNAIKAKLHNQAYVNLKKKVQLPGLIVIDQFTPEKSYYRYLTGEKEIIRGIHFETKAEDKYLSVGAASVIARYAFLRVMDAMDEKYGMHFSFGSGASADESARLFVQKYGADRLGEVAKLHFKNTEKILQK